MEEVDECLEYIWQEGNQVGFRLGGLSMNKEEIEETINGMTREELLEYTTFCLQYLDKENKELKQTIKQKHKTIEQLENKVKALEKGNNSLLKSRKKWKDRYYKEKNKIKEQEINKKE